MRQQEWINSKSVAIGLIVLLSVVTTLLLQSLSTFSRIEAASFDQRVSLFRSQTAIHEDVVIVLIDEYSLQTMAEELGRWPWPRRVYSDLLDYFAFANAQTLAFDVLFSEQQDVDSDQSNDRALIDATRRFDNTVHAMQLLYSNDSVANQLPPDFEKKFAYNSNDYSGPFYNDFLLPLNDLYRASAGAGFLELNPDRDGVYRRVRLFNRFRDEAVLPSLASAIVMPLFSEDKIVQYNDDQMTLGNMSIPLDGEGNFLINPYGKINTYSVAHVLQSMKQIRSGQTEDLTLDPAEFNGKLVLLGASAIGLLDVKATALASKEAGVFLHAYTVSNLLQQDFLTSPPETLVIFLMLLLSLLCAAPIVVFSRLTYASLIPVVAISAYLIFSLSIFSLNQVYPITPVLSSILITVLVSYSYRSYREKYSKQKIRKMLGQYVSPGVLATLTDNPEDLHAEIGTTESLSILFSDIRNFTDISESYEASQVVDLLNIYFSEMTEIIFKYNGTLDKFIGDAIMCFWGAPVKVDNHAIQSVYCAIEMQKGLTAVNRKLLEKGYPRLEIGVGIHSGKVILGNIGSDKKLDYTIIGDGVNLASRLEGLTKSYGCSVLISDSTRNQIGDSLFFIPVDSVRVKGKKQQVFLYTPTELFCEQNDIQLSLEQLQEKVTIAHQLYQNRDWLEAKRLYGEIGNCVLSQIFQQRCTQYQNEQPDSEWDGVHSFTNK